MDHLLPAYKTALGKVAGQGYNKIHRTLTPCLQDRTIGKIAGQGYNKIHRTLTPCLQDCTIGKVAGQGYNKIHGPLTPCLQDRTRQSRRSGIQQNTQNTYSLPTRPHYRQNRRSGIQQNTQNTYSLPTRLHYGQSRRSGIQQNTWNTYSLPTRPHYRQSRRSGIQQNTRTTYSLPTRLHWAKSPVRDTTKYTDHLLPCLQDCTGQSLRSGIQENMALGKVSQSGIQLHILYKKHEVSQCICCKVSYALTHLIKYCHLQRCMYLPQQEGNTCKCNTGRLVNNNLKIYKNTLCKLFKLC